jgi:hypothetical protein
MADDFGPERTVRLLRAKTAELENQAKRLLDTGRLHDGYMSADIALIAGLLADHIERTEQRLYNLEGPMVEVGDPLFNEDGTPWRRDEPVCICRVVHSSTQGNYHIADLTCPIHGIEGSMPGDWID